MISKYYIKMPVSKLLYFHLLVGTSFCRYGWAAWLYQLRRIAQIGLKDTILVDWMISPDVFVEVLMCACVQQQFALMNVGTNYPSYLNVWPRFRGVVWGVILTSNARACCYVWSQFTRFELMWCHGV